MKTLQLAAVVLIVSHASAADWPVAPGGSIQTAIDAAADGDTITIAAGTYYENLIVNGKHLRIRGESPIFRPVLDGGLAGSVLHAHGGACLELWNLVIAHGQASRGAGLLVEGSPLEMHNCLVDSNAAGIDGGGIWCDTAPVFIEACEVRNNGASQSGGGIWCSADSCLLLGNEIHRNSAFDGGGVWASGTTAIFEDNEVHQNSADTGLGIWCSGSGSLIVGNQIHDNSEPLYAQGGGGVYCLGDGCVFFQNEFFDNSIDYSGAGVWSSGDDLIFRDNEFRGNISDHGYGASIYAEGDDCQVLDCAFDSNYADYYGAYFTGARTLVEDCHFVNNRHGSLRCNGSSTVSDCQFEKSSSTYWEAAVNFFDGTGGSLLRCEILNCSADMSAAGVRVLNSQVELSDCLIANCSSFVDTNEGAGVYILNSDVTISRCTIANNVISTEWAPVYMPGAGLYVDGTSTVGMGDSIVYGNRTPEMAVSEIRVAGGTLSVGTSDVRGGWAGPGNIDADPLFRDPLIGDFTLQPASPCVDAAHASANPGGTDLYGMSRLLDGNLDWIMRLDMGACEYGNLRIRVSGAAMPGGTLVFDLQADKPMLCVLLVADTPGEVPLPSYGTVFFDLAGQVHAATPWLTWPLTQVWNISPLTATPQSLIFQGLGYDAPLAYGNLSNAVVVEL